jgi:hypothetical protein
MQQPTPDIQRTPTIYADLEIGIHRRDIFNYSVDLRFIDPRSDADIRLVQASDLPLARFDAERLRAHGSDSAAYGQALSAHLFADPHVSEGFAKAMTMAQALDMPLRVRLFIGPSAPDLHMLRWETLVMPGSDELMLTREDILFSRYLSSTSWRPVRLRPRSELRALLVIANPTNLSTFKPGGQQLAPIDVAGEQQRAAEAGLVPHATSTTPAAIPTTVLASNGQATLANIIAHLREGYDILYLVAHGAIVDDVPRLWLEDDDGYAAVIPGNDLVNQVRELRQHPRLVVLASCQSGALMSALGPRLVDVGVPAVLAMQDNITLETAATFMPCFFDALQQDGQIDRAVAVARGRVRDRHDWWVPVLFMRLKGGCIWYVPGFGERKGFERWPALIKNIEREQCTPILGTHLSELLGSSTEIAQRWAEKHNFPLEPYRCEYLSQVAQYLAVTQQPLFPRDDLLDRLYDEILDRYGSTIAEAEQQGTFEELLAAVGRHRRQHNEADPYRVLAELPFKVYITANFTNLLTEALEAAGKHPVVELCRWNEHIETLPSIYDKDKEPGYLPDVQRPLVYHLFGHISEPDSLVVTEDDYFDYLIGFASNEDLVPGPVNEALSDNGLLFLGFQPDDWDFRILFRSLAKLWVARRRQRYINISAQIAPSEDRIQEPVRARRYLEAYFREASIDIYWGHVEDFARELLAKWREATSTPRRRRR